MKQWELRGVTVQDRPRVNRSLVDSIDPLRILVNQLPALFWTTDAELVVTSSLGAEFDRLGLGANQLVGTSLADVFDDGRQTELIDAHTSALRGASVLFEAAWAGRAFRARVAPLRDLNDQIIGTICVAVEKSRAERAGPVWSDR
jgi:PAS domain-containing protein